MILPTPSKPLTVYEFLKLSPEERRKRNEAAIAVLDSFMQGDEKEQRETLEFLMDALDEDRPSYRKLFPERWAAKHGISPENDERERRATDKSS